MTDCIAESQDYADLFADSPKAAALFLMMLPFPDCYGILSADTDVFRGRVCPKLRLRDVRPLLEAMERHQLVERYFDSGDKPLLWVRKYHKHQDVRWDRVGPPDHELPPDWECPDELVVIAEANPSKPIGRWYARRKAELLATPGDSGILPPRVVQSSSDTDSDTERLRARAREDGEPSTADRPRQRKQSRGETEPRWEREYREQTKDVPKGDFLR